MFTDAVRHEQTAQGSRETYARMTERPAPAGLGEDEIAFLTSRSSVYIATVSQSGWPYVQHRGGPRGFIKVTGPDTIAFADYRGNRQYVSKGNLTTDDRVSIFAMDYPRKARLKLLGHALMQPAESAPDLVKQMSTEGQGKVERVVTVRITAFDWNCPQFITPRFDTEELTTLVGPEITRLENRIAELEAELADLRS